MKSDALLKKLEENVSKDVDLGHEIKQKVNCNVLFLIKDKDRTVRWMLYAKGDQVQLEQLASENSERGDVELEISDKNLSSMANGKTSAQKLFLKGQLKVKRGGNHLKKLMFIEALLKKTQLKAKL